MNRKQRRKADKAQRRTAPGDRARGTSATMLRQALSHHRAGRLAEAMQACREILEKAPNDPQALHLLGVAKFQTGDARSALELVGKAIEVKPNFPEAYNNLGNLLGKEGRLEEAVAAYSKALEQKPDFVDACNNIGVAFKVLGRFGEAAAAYRKAVELKPDDARALNNLGVVLSDQGKFDEALAAHREAVKLKPEYADAWYNSGNALKDLNEFAEAEAAYRKAVELKPDDARAYNNLGVVLGGQGKLNEAMAAYHEALRLKPDYADTYNNLGVALGEQGKLEEASAVLLRALELDPDSAEIQFNLGNVLRDKGELDGAVAAFERAVVVDPNYDEARASLLNGLQHLCDWSQIDAMNAEMDKVTADSLAKGAKAPESPFISVTRCQDPSRNLEVARSWSADIAQRMSGLREQPPANLERDINARLKIGYLSADLHSHATAHLMGGLFGLHDRNGFEVHAYSYGPDDKSDYRKRIENDCDAFIDVRDCSTIEAARRIHHDGIDILVDLKGYTRDARLNICALRPAPVQVSYLGFPGSTGADFLDYVLTDRVVTPPDQAPFYSEKFVYLPHCYQVNDHAQAISDKPFARADFGLPEDGLVLCSFNQSYKIEPVMWAVWMRILRTVPGCVLWLLRGNETVARNLRREAAARDVGADRIIFGERLPKAEHLARLKLADLFLDTRIVNSHTTASDALWAGVPIVTLRGTHFASRVASSLLSAIDLPELVTQSLEDYEALVLELSREPESLKALREKLWRNRLVEPLFDTPRFVRNLEQAYHMMWELHAAGKAPRQLEVPVEVE